MPLFPLIALAPPAPPLLGSKIVTSVRRAAPNVPFLASLKLTMQPGWHTYWKNPGDNGVPVDAKLTVPAGWKVEALEWPVPHRIVTGSGVTFGYEDSVELLYRITPNGKSGWVKALGQALVCQAACVPAKIFAATQVTVGGRDAEGPESGRLRLLADSLPIVGQASGERVVRQGKDVVLSGFGDVRIFDFEGALAFDEPLADGMVKVSPYGSLGKTLKLLVVPKQGRARVLTLPVTPS